MLPEKSDKIFTKGVVCLAPMVRASSMALRSLCIKYGADLVWSEEVVDRRMVKCRREVNTRLGTIDFVVDNATVLFRTDPALEKNKIIFQIGTCDAKIALKAAEIVQNDVAAIDINMGCPKKFSTQGGMGAALLANQDVACEIIRTLSTHLTIPVTAKIRLLDSVDETIAFIHKLEKAGVAAVTVHLRQRGVESTVPAAGPETMRRIVEAVTVPVIANGDLYTQSDMARMLAESGCCGVMLARPVLLNASLIRRPALGGVLPQIQVIHEFLQECLRYEPPYQIVKYTLMEMMVSRRHTDGILERLGGQPVKALFQAEPEVQAPPVPAPEQRAAEVAECASARKRMRLADRDRDKDKDKDRDPPTAAATSIMPLAPSSLGGGAAGVSGGSETDSMQDQGSVAMGPSAAAATVTAAESSDGMGPGRPDCAGTSGPGGAEAEAEAEAGAGPLVEFGRLEPEYSLVTTSRSLREICEIFGMDQQLLATLTPLDCSPGGPKAAKAAKAPKAATTRETGPRAASAPPQGELSAAAVSQQPSRPSGHFKSASSCEAVVIAGAGAGAEAAAGAGAMDGAVAVAVGRKRPPAPVGSDSPFPISVLACPLAQAKAHSTEASSIQGAVEVIISNEDASLAAAGAAAAEVAAGVGGGIDSDRAKLSRGQDKQNQQQEEQQQEEEQEQRKRQAADMDTATDLHGGGEEGDEQPSMPAHRCDESYFAGAEFVMAKSQNRR